MDLEFVKLLSSIMHPDLHPEHLHIFLYNLWQNTNILMLLAKFFAESQSVITKQRKAGGAIDQRWQTDGKRRHKSKMSEYKLFHKQFSSNTSNLFVFERYYILAYNDILSNFRLQKLNLRMHCSLEFY